MILNNSMCCGSSAVDAARDTDTVVRRASDRETRHSRDGLPDPRDARQMTDVVLRERPGPPLHNGIHRYGADPGELAQIVRRHSDELSVVTLQDVVLPDPSDGRTYDDVLVGQVWPLGRHECERLDHPSGRDGNQ